MLIVGLGHPDPATRDQLVAMTGLAVDAVEVIVAEGPGAAMTRFNTRPG